MPNPTRREVTVCGVAAAVTAMLPASSFGADCSPCSNFGALLFDPDEKRVGSELRRLEVFSENDFPPCVSRVITRYMTHLGRLLPDELRPRLRSYAARLAGTATTVELERRRAEFLALSIVQVVAARALRLAGYPEHAHACETAADLRAGGSAAGVAQHHIGRYDRPGRDERLLGYGCAAQAQNACDTAAATEFRWVPDTADRAIQAIENLQDVLAAVGDDPQAAWVWDFAFGTLDRLVAMDRQPAREASCAAGRAALTAADYDVPCWAREQEGSGPRIRSRLLAKPCTTCAGTGGEWVDKSELHEATLAFLADTARQSLDGRQIEIRCTTCSGDGRYREPDPAVAAWWEEVKKRSQEQNANGQPPWDDCGGRGQRSG